MTAQIDFEFIAGAYDSDKLLVSLGPAGELQFDPDDYDGPLWVSIGVLGRGPDGRLNGHSTNVNLDLGRLTELQRQLSAAREALERHRVAV